MESVKVKVLIEEPVLRPIAVEIASEFLEWLDSENFELVRKPNTPKDRRDSQDYRQLASDYVSDRW